MKKLILGAILLSWALVFPLPTTASVDIHVNIPLPPLIVFSSPPEVVVLPETYIYVVPDADVDIFFYDGWWWRPWEGRWYRSRHYNSGWAHYQNVPSFYRGIPSGWRNDYREHRWQGHQWDHQRIPHERVQQNWRNWEKSRHWEKQNTWGVQGLKHRTRSQQPSRAVQKPSPARPLDRETTKPERARPQPREAAQPQRPREARPERAQPQARETAKPQRSQETKTEQVRPQSRETSQPQQAKRRQGKPEKGEEEKQDRK